MGSILELQGNYVLKIEFGGNLVPIQPQMIKEVSITQDMEHILPTFRIAFMDAGGLLTNVIPYDKDLDSVSIEVGRSLGGETLNEFRFRSLRRKGDNTGMYEISGVLDVPELMDVSKSRGWENQEIKTVIEEIATKELLVAGTEVGSSLAYNKTLVQPDWTTFKLFRYLKENLVGVDGQGNYYAFVKNLQSEKIFVFKSLEELYSGAIKYEFIVGEEPYGAHYPILSHQLYDNSSLLSDLSAKTQHYGYFDYNTGAYVNGSVGIEDVPGLSEFFLVNEDDNNSGSGILNAMGRSNDFTEDFQGKVKSKYFNRIGGSMSMWATTWGIESINPGDIVKVLFSESLRRGNLFVYQHTGYWIVKRVVHQFNTAFHTTLLLVRGGIDTDVDSGLIPVTKRMKK